MTNSEEIFIRRKKFSFVLATVSDDPDKTVRQRKREQLRLALDWNRVDIARNYIMTNARDWEVRTSNFFEEIDFTLFFSQNMDINDMFELALTRVQTDFVKLFLEHDFSLTEVFRNKQLLPSLYMSSLKEVRFATSSHLYVCCVHLYRYLI